VVFFTKSNSSEQNIYRNRRLKYIFNVLQAKTKHEKSRQTQQVYSKNISTVLLYKWSLIIFLNLHNYFLYFSTLLEVEATLLKPYSFRRLFRRFTVYRQLNIFVSKT
jgi:hypothetical protein